MCRYNFSIANKSISQEFAFTRADMGLIITTALFAYACGQIINGLLTDKIGGKRAMLIGAAGTILMNLLFGTASTVGCFAPATLHGGHGLYERLGSVELSPADIQNVPTLSTKLLNDTNPVPSYLRLRLSERTQALLQSPPASASDAQKQAAALT